MPRRGHLLAATAGAALALALGCTRVLGDNQAREPNTALPGSFAAAAAPGPSVAAQRQWDAFFADPDLRSLIAEALQNNQQLNIQLQEIIIAGTEVAARRGAYTPSLDAAVGAGVEKVPAHTSQGVGDAAHGVPDPLPDLRFGLVASWETDIAGGLRSARRAASARHEATIQERNFLLTEIVAEIANSYYDLVALDAQLAILQRNLELQRGALEVVRLKKLAARGTELGVQRFQAEVVKNQGRSFALEQQRIVVENRINFLVGRFPQPVRRNAQALGAAAPDLVAAGLPSELLDNRPDVKAAELRLAAAKLDVRGARARFYPALRLDADLGFRAFNPAHLVDLPQSLFATVAGNLVAPLLNRAAIKADYRAANARQIQAVLDYERAILRAYTEVHNQLTAITKLGQRYEQVSQQVTALHAAIEVSRALYQSAQVDYYEVLMVVRDALEAEMELVEARASQMQAVVAVYRALGGGWRTGQDRPTGSPTPGGVSSPP